MIHGRNAGPENILDLVPVLDRPTFAYLAPAANGGTWYPYSFMAEREKNEPGISSGLAVIDSIVTNLLSHFTSDKIVLLGFSQGACLTSEYALRHPRKYGGVMILSGGLIGPPRTKWNEVTGSFEDAPVFLGCSDVDPHIPKERVLESEAVFRRMNAACTRRLYPNMGHVVNKDEIEFVQQVMDQVLAAPDAR